MICVGFAGLVPRIQKQVGMTFHEASHAALNEFTAEMSTLLDPAAGREVCRDVGTPIDNNDAASCHTGCSLEPPRLC